MRGKEGKVAEVLQFQGIGCAKALWWNESREPVWLETMQEDRKGYQKVSDISTNVQSQ